MDSKALSSIIYNFSVKFCNELGKTKNVVSSPLSAETLLALLTLGTTDQAHSELLAALEFTDDDAIRSTFSTLSSQLKSVKGITLDVANKVYIKDGSYDLHPQLKEDAVKIFDAEMEKINFADAASAVNNINTWVESKTNSKIKDLLSEDSVNSDTRVILINALYFKGSWKDRFDPSATKEHPFHLNATSTVQVPMMFKKNKYTSGHSEHLQAKLLEIPYEDDEASMLLVVPTEIEGLNNVLTKLAAGHDLMTDITNMHQRQTYVMIPKFKIETEIDLKELLPKLGINAIFNCENSGLTKILNNDEPLYVSNAIQKAFIEVNEEGTEATAASGVEIEGRSMPPQCYADRPFLYVLFGAGRVPLFVGVYRGVD